MKNNTYFCMMGIKVVKGLSLTSDVNVHFNILTGEAHEVT